VKQRTANGLLEVDFSTMDEAIAFADRDSSTWRMRSSRSRPRWYDILNWRRRSRIRREVEFLGTRTWTEASDLARNGWKEGADLILAAKPAPPPVMISVMPGPAEIKHRRKYFDVAGSFPDIPAYLSGDPDCMHAEEDEYNQADEAAAVVADPPVIRLALSTMCGHQVSFQELLNGGVAALSAIRAFEDAGFHVDVTWIARSSPNHAESRDETPPEIVIRVPLKAPNEALDINRLAFWCMHVGAIRRFEFGVEEQLDIEKWYPTYGRAVTDEARLSAAEPDRIVLVLGNGFRSVKAGLDYIYSRFPRTLIAYHRDEPIFQAGRPPALGAIDAGLKARTPEPPPAPERSSKHGSSRRRRR
jgi:hypothetical protein